MENVKNMGFRLLIWIFVWFVILGGSLALFVHWEAGNLKADLYALEGMVETSGVAVGGAFIRFNQRFWLALGAGLLVTGVLLWVSLRASLKGFSAERKKAVTAQKSSVPDLETKEQAGRENRRRELHLVSLLQREGRLVDFLKEDLELYEDAQIGAAVRSIHENCQKTLNRYVDPQAILDQEEGEEVTVPQGFDPSVIKLTGNVSGDPPFRGTLQHRGWRVGSRNLPVLSGTLDPDIISPAEVEIL